MAFPVYSRRFVTNVISGASTILSSPVPSGKVWVVKDMNVWDPSLISNQIQILSDTGVGPGVGAVWGPITGTIPAPGGVNYEPWQHWTGMWVLEFNESIVGFQDQHSHVVGVTISGYELTLP